MQNILLTDIFTLTQVIFLENKDMNLVKRLGSLFEKFIIIIIIIIIPIYTHL
jgi:hypothetical protein